MFDRNSGIKNLLENCWLLRAITTYNRWLTCEGATSPVPGDKNLYSTCQVWCFQVKRHREMRVSGEVKGNKPRRWQQHGGRESPGWRLFGPISPFLIRWVELPPVIFFLLILAFLSRRNKMARLKRFY